MNITEKYCLKWNEFSLYICDSFKELRDAINFCDYKTKNKIFTFSPPCFIYVLYFKVPIMGLRTVLG